MSADGAARQLDRLELAALAYLLAPMPLFVWGWWRWPVALALTALLAVSAWAVLARRQRGSRPLGRPLWLLLALAALLWVAGSGLLGGLPLAEDWRLRMIVLHDLTLGAWPVSYGEQAGTVSLLRFSMGYYLLPAWLGACLGGVDAARLMQGVWTLAGVLLFLALFIQSLASRRLVVVAAVLAVAVLFSGMDILGFALERARWPGAGEHIEWWAPQLQYSSQTTLLFWVPNHALPAWLGAAVVWRHRQAGLAPAPAALLLLAAALWSPLACVGLLPLLAVASGRQLPLRAWLLSLRSPAALAVVPALGVLAAFVTFGIDKGSLESSQRALAEVGGVRAAWHQLGMFALMEWGLIAAALLAAVQRPGWVFWASCGLLLLLPLVSFGGSNDLLMRAGIAPLTLLMFCVAQALADGAGPARWRAALLLMLAVGAVTPAQEFWRQTQGGQRWPDRGVSMRVYQGSAWHYVGRLQPGLMAWALREPQPLSTVAPEAPGR